LKPSKGRHQSGEINMTLHNVTHLRVFPLQGQDMIDEDIDVFINNTTYVSMRILSCGHRKMGSQSSVLQPTSLRSSRGPLLRIVTRL
jgi:hypothetical protein